MGKKLFGAGITFLVMAAGLGPLRAAAAGDPLASPTPRPTQRITAPAISGVNPEVVLSEGEQGEITPSGSFSPAGVSSLPGNPIYVNPVPQPQEGSVQDRIRQDLNCGPASLAAALRLLDQGAGQGGPSAAEVEGWLRDRGLMSHWGTGVEELAYAARAFGYPASQAFHGWSLEKLAGELEAGRPVLVNLGVNGPGRPGHFLTVTAISASGDWVSCLDPDQGRLRLTREDFLNLWELQGRSGVALGLEPLPPEADPMLPWMGLLGAVSALALSLNLTRDERRSRLLAGLRRGLADPGRPGVGAGYLSEPPGGNPEPDRPPPGLRPGVIEVPVYETRQVKVGLRGIKKQVPVYETKQVFAGLRKDLTRVPVFGRRKVQTGTRWVEKKIKVTRCRWEKVRTWKKVTERVPVTRWLGAKEFVIGYRDRMRWKRVWTRKRVPYQAVKTILVKEPVYGFKRVQTGWKTVVRWVPKYREEQVLVGSRTVYQTVPVFEQRRVQVGTRLVNRQLLEEEGGEGQTGRGGDEEAGRSGEGEAGGLGEGERGRSGADKDLKLLEKLSDDPDVPGAPTGFSAQVWKSLSDQDRTRIRQEGLEWLREQVELEKIKKNRVYRAYEWIQNLREGVAKFWKNLGLPSPKSELPHLVSISVEKHVPLNVFTQDGVVINSFKPPNIVGLLYMEQDIDIQEKVVMSAYPEGIFDINLSTGSRVIKLGNINIFWSLSGESGFSYKLGESDPIFEETWQKISWAVDTNTIYIKEQVAGINWHEEFFYGEIKTKKVSSISCKLKSIRKETVLVVLGAVVLFYLLIRLGTRFDYPLWQEYLNYPVFL